MKLAHDELGNHSFNRTYMLVRRLYYWEGLKNCVKIHLQQCVICQRQNSQVDKYAKLNFSVPELPMQFIAMDLFGSLDSLLLQLIGMPLLLSAC